MAYMFVVMKPFQKPSGKGYCFMSLNYIQNVMQEKIFYMIVNVTEHTSVKGIEKSSFVRYAERVN